MNLGGLKIKGPEKKINGIKNVFKRVAFLTRFYEFKSSGKMRNFAFIKK
jgi:hypothetical protein